MTDEPQVGTELPPYAKLEQCREASCGQVVWFAHVLKKDHTMGKPTPIDYPRKPGGGHLILVGTHTDERGRTLPVVRHATAEEKQDAEGLRYTGHFGTCTNPERFRRR